MEFSFVSGEELLALHEDQLRIYGGQSGFIDEGVVRSALNRAQFTLQYVPDSDVADLAADYPFGFATTQGFMDGNKRTAVVAALLFLDKNGWDVAFTDELLMVVALAVAKSDLDRDGLVRIFRTHLKPMDQFE